MLQVLKQMLVCFKFRICIEVCVQAGQSLSSCQSSCQAECLQNCGGAQQNLVQEGQINNQAQQVQIPSVSFFAEINLQIVNSKV